MVGIVDGATSKLNPPADTVLTADQTLIVVVEDDSALEGQSRSLTEPALNKLGQQSSLPTPGPRRRSSSAGTTGRRSCSASWTATRHPARR